MKFFRQRYNGIKKRWQWWSFGVIYRRESDLVIPDILRVNGKKKQFFFLNPTSQAFRYEFTEICLHDCYKLSQIGRIIRPSPAVIVDIGANQGLFCLAARQHFPYARIIAYEPNPGLENVLALNASSVEALVHMEAVTREDCIVTLQFSESDLHTIASPSNSGNLTGTSFNNVIKQAGGQIDILKMDCEGGEWELLEEIDAWNKIKAVTMEYHLWAKKGSRVEDVIDRLNYLNFEVIALKKLDEQFGLIAAMNKRFI